MDRTITGFATDEEGAWVARLSCGHRRHVRHEPPLSDRAWVATAEGREARLGSPLDCGRCDRLEVPEGWEPRQRTATFSRETVPAALLAHHTTRAGVWARIHVVSGRVRYHVEPPLARELDLSPRSPGTVAPEVPHRVELVGDASFYVEFWRGPPEARG